MAETKTALQELNKILIIRLSSIGDIILTTPLLRSTREKFPLAQIDYLTKKEFTDILKNSREIDHLIEFDKNTGFTGLKALKKKIRSEKYDLLIDLHNNLRSNYLKFNSGIRFKTTYSKKLLERFMLVKFGRNIYKELKQVYLRYFESVKRFDIQYDHKGTEVVVSEDNTTKIKEILRNDHFDFEKSLIVICPGASYSNKRWIAEGYGVVAGYFYHKKNAFIAFAGGKQDTEICWQIIDKFDLKAVNYAGRFSLAESASLLKEASLVITNDTGMMHLSQAVKTPVVAIFGPTTQELGFFPIPENSKVVENDLKCRPCTFKGLNYCPEKHFNCMKGIRPVDVIKEAENLLETP